MFTIKCDKCGKNLFVDERLTFDEYRKDNDYVINSEGEIVDSSLQNYLMYKCVQCGEIYKFTYKDLEKRYRKKIAEDVLLVKQMKEFKHINPQYIDPDNGLEWCGQCKGYAGDGYCLKDIIKQCTIRK